MGTLINYITGGNEKVSAYRLADLHHASGGDYRAVVSTIFFSICQQRPKNSGFVDYFRGNGISNYCDLAGAQLNALAAPRGTPLLLTIMQCRDELAKHLRARGIPEQFISGDNTALTKELASQF
jgi:hypothetical protein